MLDPPNVIVNSNNVSEKSADMYYYPAFYHATTKHENATFERPVPTSRICVQTPPHPSYCVGWNYSANNPTRTLLNFITQYVSRK